MTTAGAAVLPGTGEMSDTKCQKDLDFVSEVDRDVCLWGHLRFASVPSRFTLRHIARSTFPIV